MSGRAVSDVDAALSGGPADRALDAVYRRITWRVVPILCLGYLVSYIDRVNVGFAKLQMLGDLHMSEAVYGFGVSLFFITYILCEVPSNLLLVRTGPRVWLARIMISWGAVSACMALVHTPLQFYVCRFLLGAAEAGFLPGVLYYLAGWYPPHRRARVTAVFMAGIPLSSVLGGPVSGLILSQLSGKGLAGWQWLFLIEAAPAVVLGGMILWLLPRSIEGANWLTPHEKGLIQADLGASPREHHGLKEIFQTLLDRKVLLMGGINATGLLGVYTIAFWFPSTLKEAGVADPFTIGMLVAVPNLVAVIALWINGVHSDRTGERRWHIAIPMLIGAGALALSTLAGANVPLVLGLISIANAGIVGSLGPFWTLPTSLFRGAKAAVSLATVGSIANVAGFFATALVGWVKELTHSSIGVTVVFAGVLAIGAATVALLPRGLQPTGPRLST